MKTRYLYLPALSDTMWFDLKYVLKGREWISNTWMSHSFFDYPYYLMSYHFVGKRFPTLLEDIGFPRDRGILFADSGGFSVVTAGAKIDPKDVIEWQNKNCTCGVILDLPPYSTEGNTAQFGGRAVETFKESLKGSVKNATIMYERWNREWDFMGVIQGETMDQKLEWYEKINAVAKEEPFRGWALSPKPSSDKYQVLSYMNLARLLGIKKIHLLQVSGVRTMAALFYLGRKLDWFDLVTFDSSTFIRKGNGFRTYNLKPFKNAGIKINDKTLIKKDDQYIIKVVDDRGVDLEKTITELPCNCPICRHIENKDFKIFQENTAWGGYLISLHNLSLKLKEAVEYETMSMEELKLHINDQRIVEFADALAITNSIEEQRQVEKGCSSVKLKGSNIKYKSGDLLKRWGKK